MKPNQKLLIITTDPSMLKWRSRKKKLEAISAIINEMDNANITIDVEYRDLRPAVFDGRITHEWMDGLTAPEKKRGYAWVALHMSGTQHKRWGVKPTLRGLAQDDTDTIGEAYFWADEQTLRGERNQFIETCVHEFRHLIFNGLDREDDTHAIHDAKGTLAGSFKGIDFSAYNPARKNQQTQITLLRRVIPMLTTLIGLRKRTTLYRAAISFLGRDASPRDLASDDVGCAESVSMVIREVLADFPIVTGTWTLNERLKSDAKNFKLVSVPMPGTIIISPTGTSQSTKVRNGHVGIFGGGDTIMSNDSNTGFWEENYTLSTWHDRWTKQGYQTLMYQLIQ